jgi:hypothetical protein
MKRPRIRKPNAEMVYTTIGKKNNYVLVGNNELKTTNNNANRITTAVR